MHWWVGPSSPTSSPQWVSTSLGWASLMSDRRFWLCTSSTPKTPKVEKKVANPSRLSAPASAAVWCSWIPASKYAPGDAAWKRPSLTEPSRSQQSATTLGTGPALLAVARSAMALP